MARARRVLTTGAAALALALGTASAPAASPDAGEAAAQARHDRVLPVAGVLEPGRSLGGIVLGMTKRAVRERWGSRYGRCRSCSIETWYFTYRRFKPEGAAVGFRRGVVARVYTLWKPVGWTTPDGLALGASVDDLRAAFPDARVTLCDGYEAHVVDGTVATAFYVLDDRLWGFGLARSASSACPQ